MINNSDIDAMSEGRLVGLAGPMGSGKSTAAGALIDNKWRNVKFAGALKSMAAGLFEYVGLDPVRCIEGNLKETPLAELGGHTPRFIMQTLGTEWGRNILGSEFWVNIAHSKIKKTLENGHDVVVDDVRFDNEAGLIKRLGGVVVGITGRGDFGGDHASENGVECDFEIQNNKSAWEFQKDVVYILDSTTP